MSFSRSDKSLLPARTNRGIISKFYIHDVRRPVHHPSCHNIWPLPVNDLNVRKQSKHTTSLIDLQTIRDTNPGSRTCTQQITHKAFEKGAVNASSGDSKEQGIWQTIGSCFVKPKNNVSNCLFELCICFKQKHFAQMSARLGHMNVTQFAQTQITFSSKPNKVFNHIRRDCFVHIKHTPSTAHK